MKLVCIRANKYKRANTSNENIAISVNSYCNVYSCEFTLITFFSFGNRRAGREGEDRWRWRRRRCTNNTRGTTEEKDRWRSRRRGCRNYRRPWKRSRSPRVRTDGTTRRLVGNTLYIWPSERNDRWTPQKVQSWNETNRKKRKRTKQ